MKLLNWIAAVGFHTFNYLIAIALSAFALTAFGSLLGLFYGLLRFGFQNALQLFPS